MRKKCFYAAALAMMLASCSQELETPQLQVQEGKPAIAGKTPIGFNVYTNRPITRAGITGDLNTERLKDLNNEDGKPGFGVFAYYTDNLDYTCQTKPNFMYNQQVTAMDAETWTYEPVKYWPNEFGDVAQSKDQDKVSFFAYAPYVECDPATGKLIDDPDTQDDESTLDTYGITGFSKNTFAGDPYVKYIASFDMSKAVDLCYGTVASGYERWQILNGGVQDLDEGMPYLSVEHPAKLDQKMKFNFKHALAQLNVKIDVDADVNAHGSNGAATGTKVYVRSISFKGFAMKGALNLNNTEYDKARWMHYNGQGLLSAADAETFLVNDGRKNGKEGTTAAASEKNAFLNQSIISDDGNTTPGVTGDQVNLFKLDLSNATFADPENPTAEEILALQAEQLNNSVYVIPVDPDEPMSVTIVYDVETSDDKLASLLSDGTKGSRVRNEITKEISFNGGGLKSGYKHTINLHLGLNSVKFDATVSGWRGNGGTANPWLPITENPGEGTFNPGNSLNITSINGAAPAEDMSGSNAVKAAINGINKNSALNTMSVQSDSDQDGSTEWMIENTQVAAIKAEPAAPSRAGTRNEVPEGYAATATGKSITVAPVAAGTTILHSTYKGKESTIVITVVAPSMVLSASSVNLYAFPSDSKTGSVEATWNAPSIYDGQLPTVASVVSDNEAIATATEAEGVITITPAGLAGTANLTVTDTDGNIKTVSVNVTEASLAVNKTALTLIKGKEDATLTFTATPSATFEAPEDPENGYQLQYSLSSDGDVPFTFEDGVIKAVSDLAQDMEGKLTVQFVGHTGENDPKAEVTVTVLATDITAMNAIAQAANPLLKVAQYNVASNGTSFMTKHSTASQYVFSFADVANINIDGYHVPTASELAAIVPSHNSAGNGTNIFAQNTSTFVYPAVDATGEFAVASGIGGQFVQNGAKNDLYACRKLGENLTAWHYKWVDSPCNGLLIESYVLESTDYSPENMAKIASALAGSDVWTSAEANVKPEATSENSSLVTRFLPACGYTAPPVGSGVTKSFAGSRGYYWSATPLDVSKAFYLRFSTGNLYELQDGKDYAFSVRLFQN